MVRGKLPWGRCHEAKPLRRSNRSFGVLFFGKLALAWWQLWVVFVFRLFNRYVFNVDLPIVIINYLFNASIISIKIANYI